MKTILTVTLAIFAGQAQALSCLFGDAAAAYQQAQEYDGTALPVIGALDWGERTPRDTLVMEYEGQDFDLPLRFVGSAIDAEGARAPIDTPVNLITHCINGDCGYASGGEALTFLHDINGKFVMYAYPCQSYPTAASPGAVALVQTCIDGGPCAGSFEY